MLWWGPGDVSAPFKSRCNAGANVPVTKLLLPLPDTPVTATTHPNGISIEISCKLFNLAPLILIDFPFGVMRFSGTAIDDLPDKYAPVMLSFALSNFFSEPFETILPPALPAPGPMSTSQSACRNVASSCSTTMSVLPNSQSSRNVDSNRSLSRLCKPMLGSSRTYMTPVKRVPIWVANLMR